MARTWAGWDVMCNNVGAYTRHADTYLVQQGIPGQDVRTHASSEWSRASEV